MTSHLNPFKDACPFLLSAIWQHHLGIPKIQLANATAEAAEAYSGSEHLERSRNIIS